MKARVEPPYVKLLPLLCNNDHLSPLYLGYTVTLSTLPPPVYWQHTRLNKLTRNKRSQSQQIMLVNRPMQSYTHPVAEVKQCIIFIDLYHVLGITYGFPSYYLIMRCQRKLALLAVFYCCIQYTNYRTEEDSSF